MPLNTSSSTLDRASGADLRPARGRVKLNTRRCATGCVAVGTQPLDRGELRVLHLMAEPRHQIADIGLPGAGPHVVRDVERLAREIVEQRLKIEPNCAARTVIADIRPIVESRSGRAPHRGLLLHRLVADPPVCRGVDARRMLRLSRGAVELASGRGSQ